MQKVRPAIFAAAALTATALSLGGCATKDYVDKHVAAVDAKTQATQSQVDQHQAHLSQLDQTTQDALNRAKPPASWPKASSSTPWSCRTIP